MSFYPRAFSFVDNKIRYSIDVKRTSKDTILYIYDPQNNPITDLRIVKLALAHYNKTR